MCAKGDKCAFLHLPQAAGNSAAQPMHKVFTSALQPNPQIKNSWTKPNSSAQNNTTSNTFDKSKVSAHDSKPAQKQNLTRRVDQSSKMYQKHNNSHVQSGSVKRYQPQPSVEDGIAENNMEVGEFVREPSSDSGVLVGSIDYDSEQSFKGNHNNYYHTASGEQHTAMRQTLGRHEPERPFRSSGETSLLSDKRISQREPMNVTAGSSDLRHRLLEQRRLSKAPDRYDEDRQDWRGNEHAAHDGLTRSRLQGRIKLPGEVSIDRLGSRYEREKDRGPRARWSPPKQTDLRGKLHERLKARSNEDIPDNAKSSAKKVSIGENPRPLNFAGPKSLAELKAKKSLGSLGEDSGSFVGLVHRTSETIANRDSSETIANRDSVPFDGPKPLSIILKRKREAISEHAAELGSIQEVENPAGVEGESEKKLQILESDPVGVNEEQEEEYAFHPEDEMAYDDNLSAMDDNAVEDAGRELEEPQDQDYDYNASDMNADGNTVEDADRELEEPQDQDYDYNAANMNADDNAVEDAGRELEEPQDEDYDYDAGDMNADEDNDFQEYEDDDDLEDDDDFARKVGVIIS